MAWRQVRLCVHQPSSLL